MRVFRRFVATFAVALFLTTHAVADSSDLEQPKSDAFPIPLWYSLEAQPATQLETMIAEFESNHRHLDIQPRNFSSPQELYSALEAGGKPVFVIAEGSQLKELDEKTDLTTVEEWMPRETFLFSWSVKHDVYKALFDGSSVDGRLMARPFFFETAALIYDPVLLQDKGVKAAPTTWTEFKKVAELLRDAESDTWGFAFERPENVAANLHLLLKQSQNSTEAERAEKVKKAEKDATVGSVDEAESAQQTADADKVADVEKADGAEDAESAEKADEIEVLTKILEFGQNLAQSVALPGEVGQDTKIAMRIGTVEDFLRLKRQGLNVRVAGVPGPEVQHRRTNFKVWSLGMYPVEPQDLYKAQEFAFWLLDFNQQRTWAENTDTMSAHVKVFDNPFYRQARSEAHKDLRVFITLLNRADMVQANSHEETSRLETLVKVFPKMLKGELDLQSALGVFAGSTDDSVSKSSTGVTPPTAAAIDVPTSR